MKDYLIVFSRGAGVFSMNLGELEKLVLKYFWQTPVADAKQVHAHFERSRGGSLNTIQSTLDRLYKKGLLARTKESHAYKYQAAKQRKAFIGELIQDVTQDFTHGSEGNLVAAFVSLSADLNETQLNELERLILEYRGKINSEESA
ncbi:MAG: BlaI/MecI/CopY family transcriptional regulator [Robiginitomaculum sp.]|nr:BlaI/MecI/CopY family transcriptional regulator [Robiginitomaculum sp.]